MSYFSPRQQVLGDDGGDDCQCGGVLSGPGDPVSDSEHRVRCVESRGFQETGPGSLVSGIQSVSRARVVQQLPGLSGEKIAREVDISKTGCRHHHSYNIPRIFLHNTYAFALQIRSNEEDEHRDGLRSHVERDDVRRDARDLRDFGGPSNGDRRQGAKNPGGIHARRIRERNSVR